VAALAVVVPLENASTERLVPVVQAAARGVSRALQQIALGDVVSAEQ
jgi:hypothetical protein